MHIPGELIPIVIFTMIPLTVIGAPIARAIARRIERGPSGGREVSGDVAARLERMEQAIDAIAVEVERIAEGQRFTSKLLAGRADTDRSESDSPARVPYRVNQ